MRVHALSHDDHDKEACDQILHTLPWVLVVCMALTGILSVLFVCIVSRFSVNKCE